MKVYKNINECTKVENAVVTTGMFDGVHVGHQTIIKRLQEIAKKQNGETVLVTYTPHPRLVLFPDQTDLEMLNTQEEKVEQLKMAGVDHLIIHPFTKEFSQLSSMQFVSDLLVDQLHTKWLAIGYNHHFGRNREGSFEHLKEYGPKYGFNVEEISAKDIDSIEVSSTKIRKALKKGDIKTANSYLGYDYPLTGMVVKGKQLGRTIGYPTANIEVSNTLKLIPADGIYAVRVIVDGKTYGGMLSIGKNPTIKDKPHSIEVNIFDFNEEIYGKEITLKFIEKLRDEVKFDGIESLKEQLHLDKENSLKLL